MDCPTKKKVVAVGVTVLTVALGILARGCCEEEKEEEKEPVEAVKELAGGVQEGVAGLLAAIGKTVDGLLGKGSGDSDSSPSSSRSASSPVVSSRGVGLRDLPGDLLRSQHS